MSTLTTRYALRLPDSVNGVARFPIECLACKLVSERGLHISEPEKMWYHKRIAPDFKISSLKEFNTHSNNRIHKENITLMRMYDLGFVAHRNVGNAIKFACHKPTGMHDSVWNTWLQGALVYLGMITAEGFINSMLREPHAQLKFNDVKTYLAQRGVIDTDRFASLRVVSRSDELSMLEFTGAWRERYKRGRMAPSLNGFIDAWHRSCEPVLADFSIKGTTGRKAWDLMRVVFIRRDACERLGEWMSLLLAQLTTTKNVQDYLYKRSIDIQKDDPVEPEVTFEHCKFNVTGDLLELLPALVVPSTVDDAPQPEVDVFRIRGTGRQRTDYRTVDKSNVKSPIMRLKF